MNYNDNTPVSELTVGELIDIVQDAIGAKRYVYGLQGIADLFQVSLTQAKRIKKVIGPAVAQRGNTIVVDAGKAMRIWSRNKLS